MPAIGLRAVSFSFSSAVELLVDVDLSIGPGWTGLVGPNGAGKSTLLSLIAGRPPNRGLVELDPPGATVVLCEQTVDEEPVDALALAEDWDGVAGALRARLGLVPGDLRRWKTLSPGQRKRWQVGAALASDPDVLLLDEPTNHLDPDARDLLVSALAGYRGVGIIVSHDRGVLDRLTTRTMRIADGDVTLWRGSYRDARAGWEAVRAEQLEALAAAKEERKRLERRLADQRRAREAKAARYRRAVRSSITTGDIDARSAAKAGRHAAGEAAALKRQSGTRRDLERSIDRIAALSVRRRSGGDIVLEWAPSPRRTVLGHEGPLMVDGVTLLAEAAVAVERSDRVRLDGVNGAGKSTLLRTMVERSSLPSSRVLWLPQEMSAPEREKLVRNIRALPADERGSVLAMAALLGLDPDRILGSDLASPGEARKLAIASGLGRQVWVLVLDEPTNHLDLVSIERLERALVAYPGALVMVTHDDDLAAAATDATWTIVDGELVT